MATGVPLSIITPFVGVEFDSSRAQQGPAEMPFNVVIIGQKVAAGSGVEGTMYQVYNEAEVIEYAGFPSMVHTMARRFWQNNSISDVFIVLLDDADGTLATRVLTIASGPATETRELPVYINGTRIAVPTAVGDTATVVGDAVVTAFAEHDYLNWTAANSAGVVTFTQVNDGVAAGDNDMRLNANPGEKVPAGLTASFAATTAGTVDPDAQDALDGIGDNWAHIIINPYDDATNMGVIEDFLEAAAGPTFQRDGISYQCQRDTVANLNTAATASGRNSPYMAFGDAGSRQMATYELAAAIAGQVATSVQDDPAVPLHRMTLRGVRPNALSERRTLLEANSLAKNGVMTLSDDNGLQTQNTVTMSLTNSAGAADIAYRYQNTIFILQRLRYRFVQAILSKYPRAKLMENSDQVEAGQQVITPAIGKAEALSWFLQNQTQGQVQNYDDFKDQVICRISSSNDQRLEWILPPELVKQFIVGSGILQFY